MVHGHSWRGLVFESYFTPTPIRKHTAQAQRRKRRLKWKWRRGGGVGGGFSNYTMELYGKLPPVVCPLHCSYYYYLFFEGIELDWQLSNSYLPQGQGLLLMRKETGNSK